MIDIVEFVEDYESNNCLRNEEYDCSDQKSCKDCIKEQIAKHDAEIREETKAEHDKECDTCILTGWKEKAEEIKKQAREEAIDEFATRMLYFCYGLKALERSSCRVDVVEAKIKSIKRNLKEQKE